MNSWVQNDNSELEKNVKEQLEKHYKAVHDSRRVYKHLKHFGISSNKFQTASRDFLEYAQNVIKENNPDKNIQRLTKFYEGLQCEEGDKINNLIEFYSTKMHRIPRDGICNRTALKQNINIQYKSYIYPKHRSIQVDVCYKSPEDVLHVSDILALQYFYSLQQAYGTGNLNDTSITSLREFSGDANPPDNDCITLKEHQARALKASLSPLFSSSSSRAEGGTDQIPEQLHEMKHLAFLDIDEPKFKKIMEPHIPLKGKITFLKGSHEYNQVLIHTPFGKCAARIQKKYFSSSNLTQVTVERTRFNSFFATFSFGDEGKDVELSV